jgi:hypothetical protein
MQAKRFGYWVSDDTAASLPDTARFIEDHAPGGPFNYTVLVVALFALFPGMYLTIVPGTAGASVAGLGVVAIAIAAALRLAVLIPRDRSRRRRDRLLRRHSWQAWPARSEQKDVIELLTPDGQVHKTYFSVGYMPRSVWEGMTDGLGALWVCGDLREQIVLAAPSGAPAWLATPARFRNAPAPADSADPSLLEEVIRSAASEWVKSWLGEHL